MTPKTLDKYIAALKKKAAAESWTTEQYIAELNKIHGEMSVQYLDNKITDAEYTKVVKQLANAKKNPGLQGKAQPVMQTDPGAHAADEAAAKLEKELKKVYGEAAKELQKQLDDLIKKHGPEMQKLEMDFINGTISSEDLKWLQAKTLQKKILGQKVDQLTGTMLEANKKAMGMINGEQVNVFAENANYQAYQLTQDTQMNLMFSVYDEKTAAKLLKEKPELLPRKEVNGKKDKAWNQKKIANAVLQAVIQGESIPKLARRIAVQTGETNMKAMIRYARTAMTSAQNSGRMEMLHQAQGMGIKCKKVWLATLDSRTRDSHQHLDGKTADVDEKFPNGLMFPGDPSGPPGEVYNCRCTLIYDYEGYPNDPTMDQRLMYEEWDEQVPVTKKDKNGKEYQAYETIHHRESKLITDMNYDEWKAAKEGSKLNELNYAKQMLAEAQKAVVKANVKEDKIYEGIWKDPVTLKDYPDKKDAIQAKRDYYTAEIEKYKQAQANGSSWATDEKIKDLEKKRKLLNEFEKRGQLVEKRDKALAAVQDVYGQVGFGKQAVVPNATQIKAKKAAKKAAPASGGATAGTGGKKAAGLNLGAAGAKKTPFGPEAYTKERKDKALWTTNKKNVDGMMRDRTGEVWKGASDLEKDAIYEYTRSYSKFNEPLRGIEYGTNRYLGVGKTDLNARSNGRYLNAMTDIIDKCSYDHDQWLQRGVGFGGMDKFFNCSQDLLRYGSEKQLKDALLGTTPTEYGFMSMGSAKGNGFSGNILLNIYAPSGTKMMYVEPFSAYSGSYEHRSWDGNSKQTRFGGEFETIMQQGTQFRVTKVEKSNGKIYIDMEVINQDHQQRWKR